MACLSKKNYKEVTLKNVSIVRSRAGLLPLAISYWQKTNPTRTGILLLTTLDWKSTRRFTNKLADSLQLDYY